MDGCWDYMYDKSITDEYITIEQRQIILPRVDCSESSSWTGKYYCWARNNMKSEIFLLNLSKSKGHQDPTRVEDDYRYV